MEPIILGSQDPIWFMLVQALGTFLGIVIVALVTWKIANLRIKSQFDLQKKELIIIKEKTLIELKIALIQDVEELQNMFQNLNKNSFHDFLVKFFILRDKLNSFFHDTELGKVAQRGVEANVKIGKIYENDDNSPESLAIIKKSMATIYAVLTVTLHLISVDLGFKNKDNNFSLDAIDSIAEWLLTSE